MTEEYGHISDAFDNLPEEELLMTEPLSKEFTFLTNNTQLNLPEPSEWKCYLFGSRPDRPGITYFPIKGNVPNRFVRFMMKVCFDCLWVKEDNNE